MLGSMIDANEEKLIRHLEEIVKQAESLRACSGAGAVASKAMTLRHWSEIPLCVAHSYGLQIKSTGDCPALWPSSYSSANNASPS